MNDVPGSGVYIADASAGSVRLEPRNYLMEDPSFPLDDPSVWSEGVTSASGRRVGPMTALHLPAFYQAVTRISSDVARCPLELYQETDGAYTALKKDPIYRLTAIQPNREMDAFKFWCRVMVQRLVYQNAYIFVAPNASDQPAELLPLLSDRTRPKRKGGILYFETETDGVRVPIPASRIIHIEGIGLDNLEALQLCKLMRDAFGLAMAQMDFASKVYRGGGRRGGVLEIPIGMPNGAKDKLEEGFRKKYEENGQWFTTVILRDGSKFHEAQMTLRDSQSIEGREESVRDVARALNIRPGHLGVETSGVYGNKSDDTRDYLDMTLQPHMTAIASQCLIKLLPLVRQADHCFDHNTEDLLQMSVGEEFAAYGTAIEKTILTSNEARGKLGFKPHADGDKLQSPNTVSNKHSGPPAPKKGNPPKPADDQVDDNGDPLNLAHQQLLEKTIAGVVSVIGEKAQRAATSGAKFITWLDEKLEQERDNIKRAVHPVLVCIALAEGQQKDGVEMFAAGYCSGLRLRLKADLEKIANTKSEAELKAAVTEYFQNWRTAPCHEPPKSKAA